MGSELPPLPPPSPRTNTGTESHGSPKSTGRHRRHSTTEREVKHLRDLLSNERKRADEAEARTHETLSHLKAINEARIKALHEATQAMEELKLYKIQLETAQKEIYRAQDVLKVVDRQRLDAEKEAADLRSKNRRLVEEARLQRAREQGRKQGIKEGLEKGRDFGLLEGRLMGYTPTPPQPSNHRHANRDEPPSPSSINTGHSSFTDYRPPRTRTGQPSPRTCPRSRANSITPSVISRRSVDTRGETPIPVPPPEPVSRQSSRQNLSSGPQGANRSTEDIRPISVRNRPPSPSHPATFIPPDNYIPFIDADNVIRLPPPHDFQRSPSRTDRPMSPQREPEIDDRQHRRSTGTSQRRARRHSSPESDSTTISQMDLVNDPEFNPGMRTPMSAIPEVSSSQASPDPQPARGEPDLRPQPSFAGSKRSSATSAAPPSGSTDLRVPIYTRPRTTSGSTISMVPQQEVHYQPSQSTFDSAPPISVQPPSSPSSTGTARSRLQPTSTPGRGQPSPLPVEPPNLSSSSEQTEFPSPIVLNSDQLPPNFVPMSYTPATTYTQLHPSNEETNSSDDGPPVIPDSALFGTDSSEDSEGASSMDTLTTPPTRQRSLDQQRGASVAGSHYNASQAPGTPRWAGSTPGAAAQVPLPPSTAPGTQRSTWGAAGVPLPSSTVAGTPWTESSTVGPENVPPPPSTVASNTPRWGGQASSTKSRSSSRKTKR